MGSLRDVALGRASTLVAGALGLAAEEGRSPSTTADWRLGDGRGSRPGILPRFAGVLYRLSECLTVVRHN